MGFHVNESPFDAWLTEQQKTYEIYAPKRFAGGNTFPMWTVSVMAR